MSTVTCFGEVLWDIFPGYKKIGGAPLNVALRLASFGLTTQMISRVGNDLLGTEILQYLDEHGVLKEAVQIDDDLGTGTVSVILDKKGSATYEIVGPVAWDRIQVDGNLIEKVEASGVFIYGSLAARDPISRKTLKTLLEHVSLKSLISICGLHFTI